MEYYQRNIGDYRTVSSEYETEYKGNMEQDFICDYQCEKCIGGCFGDGACYK